MTSKLSNKIDGEFDDQGNTMMRVATKRRRNDG